MWLSTCGGKETQLVVGGDERRHLGSSEVRDREEPALSKKSGKEMKRNKLRKKLKKRKTLEEDSRPRAREAVKTNTVNLFFPFLSGVLIRTHLNSRGRLFTISYSTESTNSFSSG